MKYIVLLVTIYSFNLSHYRDVYISQDEDKVLAALKTLESVKNLSPDEQCYKAVFMCMKAEYLTNPYSKLMSFKNGYALLNSLILQNKANVEYKYHRYMIEKHTPSWLISVNHMAVDKAFVKMNIKTSHPMYSFIIKTID